MVLAGVGPRTKHAHGMLREKKRADFHEEIGPMMKSINRVGTL
jgi:hypothetical protein